MNNNKAICPNCGAEGTAGRFCEYCGTKIPMPKPKRRKSNNSEDSIVKVVNFTINQDEAIKSFLNALSETQTLPKDAFEKLKIENVTPYLVPTFYYHCNFDAPWSCVKLVYEKYKVGNETKSRTKRYPMNGIEQRGFDYVLPSCNKESIPVELYNLINEYKIELAYYDQSNDCELNETGKAVLIDSLDDDYNDILRKSDFNSYLDCRVSSAVRAQLPREYEDLSYSYSYNNSIGERLVLSFWYIKYTYREEEFYFIIDGLGKKDALSKPIDATKKAEVGNLRKKADNEEIKSTLFALLWLFSIVVSCVLIYGTFNRMYKGLTASDESTFIMCTAIIYIVTIVIYKKMHKAYEKERKAKNSLESNLHSAWLHRKKSMLSTLSSNDFMLSSEAIKQLSEETNKAIKEKNPNLEKEDGRLSKWPTIIVEILGWISLLLFMFL